jgi:mono/diheme cytochrome c family protein
MSRDDLAAVAIYLKDAGPPRESARAPIASDAPAMRVGQTVYVNYCTACHGPEGAGIAQLFPALKGSPSVQSVEPTSLIRVLLEGAQSVATDPAPTGASMPAFGWKLSNNEVAAVLTYIRNSWGNAAGAVSASDVRQSRQQLSQPD